MTKHWTTILGLGLLLTLGCKTDKATETPTPAPAADSPTPAAPDAPAERAAMTEAECQAKGGTVVGDIGDGAIHRPDYRCESGQPPLGSIRAEGQEPVAVEGSVCCPVTG
jgi:hypothetical protein